MAAAESTVWTWGRAKNFRLGRAFVGTDARVPEKVSGFEGVSVRHAACGGGHTAVVLSDNRLFMFGYSQYGQLGLGDRSDMCDATQVFLIPPGLTDPLTTPKSLPVAEVYCGRYHTLARTMDGMVYTWGGGKNGRLGHADEKIRAQPTCVESLLKQKVITITAGYHNNLVLSANGEVWSWGWGAHGQLGLGDTKDKDVPTVIPELSGEGVTILSCGDRHSFAVTVDGRVYGWGSNEFGQLGCKKKGDTLLRPEIIDALRGLMIVGVSSGDRHSAAITNVGAVYTWGCGSDGQCGHGNFQDVARPKLVETLDGKFVVDVKCGHNFTMVMTSKSEVYAWGNNTYGQLGNNGNGKSNTPVKVVIGSDKKVAKVSCAHFHCIMWMQPETTQDQGKSNAATRVQQNQAQREEEDQGNTNQTAYGENGTHGREGRNQAAESYAEKKKRYRQLIEKYRNMRAVDYGGLYSVSQG